MNSVMLSRVLFSVALVVIIGTGCKKLESTTSGTEVTVTPDGGTPNIGGKGGGASINITPNHDGINIDSCKVFIKYNSSVIPKDGNYDDSVWARQVDGSPVGSFTHLKAGKYYLFARGWDLIRSQKVRGGIPFTISAAHESTNHYLTLPIQNYE